MKNKRILLAIAIVVLAAAPAWPLGFTLWGLGEQDFDSRNSAIQGRIGYQFGRVEPFIGSTWRPNFDTKPGEVRPPQVFSFGALFHWPDLIDPDSPLPWISPALLTFLPEGLVAEPYFGGHVTFDFTGNDGSFSALLIGLKCKADPKSLSAIIVEAEYANAYGDLSAVPNEFRMNFGWRFYFP